MNGSNIFIDTNILVYAYDKTEGVKQGKAEVVIKKLWNSPILPTVSVQVLQEFFVTLTRRQVSVEQAEKIVNAYLDWNVVENTRDLFAASIIELKRFKLSYWDSVILAAARSSGCSEIWSEDLSTTQNYGGLRAVNPLI